MADGRRCVGVIGAVLLLAAFGCEKDKKPSPKPTPQPRVNKPPVDKPPVDKPPVDKPGQTPTSVKKFTCRSDADCVVSCEQPNSCCGQLCQCSNVYHKQQLAKIKAANKVSCSRRTVNCPEADCAKPVTVPRAMCAAGGKCIAVKVPWGTKMVDGFLILPGSPPPQACKTASDCVGDTVPLASGCCNNPRSLRAYSRPYKRFVHKWRTKPMTYLPGLKAACAQVKCLPPPSPSQPPKCRFTMRCENNKCADSCRKK